MNTETASRSQQSPFDQLTQLFAEKQIHIKTMLDCQASLTAAFSAHDNDMISLLLKTQETVVHKLNYAGGALNQFLSAHHYSLNKEGIYKCIHALDRHEKLATSWKKICDGLEKCQYQNQVNATLVAKSQRGVQDAIHTLFGDQSPAASTYDTKGNSQRSRASQYLAEA